MNKRAFLLGAALLIGCGSVATEPSTTSTASGGNGGATTTTTSTDIGFASSSSGSMAPYCNDPTVFLDITGDVGLEHHDASCQPLGYQQLGGLTKPPPGHKTPAPMGGVVIEACSAGSDHVLRIGSNDTMWPGTSMKGNVSFTHIGVDYAEISPDAVVLEIDTLGPVGDIIEGSFSATVATNGGTGSTKLVIKGTFRVCHGPDITIV